MRIVGIDPGYDRLGIAIVERASGKDRLLYSTCIESDKNLSFADRLSVAGAVVEKILDEYSPTQAAIERMFFGKNQKTAMAVSGSRGALIYILGRRKISVHEYTPQEVKVAVTGYGNSDKKQVASMVSKLIALKKKVRYDDEFDAIGVALTHLAHGPVRNA